MYILSIIFPPLAVLMCGKPFQAIVNFGLMLLFWIPAVIHAFLVVGEYKTNERLEKQMVFLNKIKK